MSSVQRFSIALVLLGFVAGCFQVKQDYEDGVLKCSAVGNQCPEGYRCADSAAHGEHRCFRVDGTNDAGVDTCTDGSHRCADDGATLQRCEGAAWVAETTCPESCVDGQCVPCQPDSAQVLCEKLGKSCGMLTTPDNCGAERTIECGPCPEGQVCSTVEGTANTCCQPKDDATLCSEIGRECGTTTVTDNCGQQGRQIDCLGCEAPNTCGGGGTDGMCGCTPESDQAICADLAPACGAQTATDNCDQPRSVDCGCPSDQVCSTSNQCCTQLTDAQICANLGRNCGSFGYTDNCGITRTVSCGSCPYPQVCGGGGAYTCGGCSKSCAGEGIECGSYIDCNGASVTCSCPSGESCRSGTCCDCSGLECGTSRDGDCICGSCGSGICCEDQQCSSSTGSCN